MFHSNQILDVTAGLDELPFLVDTAVRLSGDLKCMSRDENYVLPAWRITNNGLYFCIGTGTITDDPDDELEDGWTEFGFKYDPKKIADKIRDWLDGQRYPGSNYTGETSHGVRMRAYHPSLTRMPGGEQETEEGWDGYAYCIACFSPWTCEFGS